MIKTILSKPLTIITIFVVLTLVGVFMSLDIAVDLIPDMNPPYVAVITVYPSASPSEVEQDVTDPLEEQLLNIEGLNNIMSTSSENMSLIILEFSWGNTDKDFSIDVLNKLDLMTTELPDDAREPIVYKFDPNSFPIMTLSIQGNRSQDELTAIAKDIVKPLLEQVNDVAKTDITGVRDKIVSVSLIQERLDAYGISANQIAQILAVQNFDLGAGSVTRGKKDFLISASGAYESIEEIKNTIVTIIPSGRDAVKVSLSDIADVQMDMAKASDRVLVNGMPGINMEVYKQSGSNTVKVAKGIHEKTEEIRERLPEGVTLKTLDDTSKVIKKSLSQVLNAALLGVACSVFILFLFLRQAKSTLIVGISIPVSIVITMLGLSLTGKTLNMVVLTGLTLGVGMIVDASIVILENIFRYRQTGIPIKAAARFGTQEMITPIFASILTTICVFLPIVLLPGEIGAMGVMMEDLAFTVIVSLLSSLAVAVLLIPVLSSTYLKVHVRGEKPIKSKFLRRLDEMMENGLNKLEAAYKWLLEHVVKHRALTVLTAIAILVISLMQFPKLGMDLMPQTSSDSVSVNVDLPVGSSLEATEEALDQLEQLIRENISGFTDIYQTAGSPSKYQGTIKVILPQIGERTVGPDEMVDNLRRLKNSLPDLDLTVNISSHMENSEMRAGSDIIVSLSGDDMGRLYEHATAIKELLIAEVPEITDSGIDLNTGLPQVDIKLNRSKVYDQGLTTQGVAAEIRSQLAGVTATTFNDSGKNIDVILQLREEDRSSLPDLEKIFVTNRMGQKISIASIAALEDTEGPVSIKHDNSKRTVSVGASISKDSSINVVDTKVRQVLKEKAFLPEDIQLSVGGSYEEIKDSMSGLSLALILAVILVLGVMISQFESIKGPLIVFLSMPMLAVGVIGIYLAVGAKFGVITFIGIIMLAGIVVNNGIVLVDYIGLLRKRGAKLGEACVKGGVSRLRPILMTSLTTILAMVPLAFFAGEGGAMMQPLGLTVVGGLTINTFTTLLLVPVLYYIFYKKEAKKNETL